MAANDSSKTFNDLPFNVGGVWKYPPRTDDGLDEKWATADRFWLEYVAFVRGADPERRTDAVGYTGQLLRAMADDQGATAGAFVGHMAEALVVHLRAGLDHTT